MRRLLFAALLMSCATPEPAKSPHSWLWGATAAQDAVRATDTHATLVARYGDANVARDRIDLGEGETEPGIVLFPSDSTRRLHVQFADTIGLRTPIRVSIAGRGSIWKLYPGVSIGTSLIELEQLNKGPFTLLGLEWDYAGAVMRWEGGTLATTWADSSGKERVIVRLTTAAGADQSLIDRVLGDREYSSVAMRTLNPRVYSMEVRPR